MTMVPMDPEKIQQMTAGYEQRIEKQKASITRLQDMIENLESKLRVAEAGLADATRKAAQLTAEVSNLRTLLKTSNASSAQPTDPHSAPVEWDRRVPEKPSGPTESTSDEVLEFNAWTQPAMPLGEQRPATII